MDYRTKAAAEHPDLKGVIEKNDPFVYLTIDFCPGIPFKTRELEGLTIKFRVRGLKQPGDP